MEKNHSQLSMLNVAKGYAQKKHVIIKCIGIDTIPLLLYKTNGLPLNLIT